MAKSRKDQSRQIRIEAADIAYNRVHEEHHNNGDESLPQKMMSFTKGLPHNYRTGLIENENHFELFVNGICSGNPLEIRKTPLGPLKANNWRSDKGKEIRKVRGWESSGAGLTFDLQGPDAQAITMKPAPKLGSDELTAELAEVYAQASLRDVPLNDLPSHGRAGKWFEILSNLNYFKNKNGNDKRKDFSGEDFEFNLDNLFKGLTSGDLVGPYLSQFLLAGNTGLNSKDSDVQEYDASEGKISYGSIIIDQKVRNVLDEDYLTTWDEYIDAQNGADFRGVEGYVTTAEKRKFITTGRDLATYVHYDALYEAYLNACLFLLAEGVSFDDGVPFQGDDTQDRQQGFAHYGGPHILTLVTEVATRALKAVRFQKFNIHRRLRPEALAARMEKKDEIVKNLEGRDWDESVLVNTFNNLKDAGVFTQLETEGFTNKLLPMAFYEGSPMHPSYGAGHATVAGACVTILKAFFKHDLYIDISEDGKTIKFTKEKPEVGRAFVPQTNGTALDVIETTEPLTLEGELNKLAANISIGRNWGGVHFYTDYSESLLLGEKIAIALLEEQAITYNPVEGFYLRLPKFDGTIIRIPSVHKV